MKIKLSPRKLPSGDTSYYLIANHKGKRIREKLGDIIVTDPTPLQKLQNKENLETIDKLFTRRKAELQEKSYTMHITDRGSEDFKSYFLTYTNKYTNKDQKVTWSCYLKFLDFLTEEKIKQLTSREVTKLLCEDFAKYLKNNMNGETPKNYFTKFRAMLSRAWEEKIVHVHSRDLKVKFQYDRYAIRKEILSKEDILNLYSHHLPEKDIERAFIFCLNTSMDLATVQSIRWKNIKNKTIIFDRTKTVKQNNIPINDIALKAIGTRRPPDEFVFNLPSSWYGNVKVLRKWCTRAGINRNITWHSARHSFATLMIQIADFRTTAEFLGQSDPKTTMKYLHANDKLKVAAVNLLPGTIHGK
jgi:integrase